MLRVFATLFLTFGAVGAAQGKSPIVVKAGHTKELCGEAYADAQIAMSDKVRELENHASYARLVQTEVQYETPYYGSDGRIQQRRSKGAFFGTAFAYMRRGDEVFFLSNAHVVSSPPVTSTDTRVDGVPPGSRKVQEESWIVERDGDGVVKIMKLTRVAVDLATDSAVLRARWPQKAQKPTDPTIEVMPYKIGRSADLHVGNFVYVRGYPLGAFQAVNVGRVTNPFDDDREGHWNHSDFIVDALLSQGHSGSPVFAVSCKSGMLELVGMYHAGYKAGSALNAVVAVDELKEFMETFKPAKRTPKGGEAALTKADRYRLTSEVDAFSPLPVFPFAGGAASMTVEDSAVHFTIWDKDFPQVVERRVWIVDRGHEAFGDVVEIGFREDSGDEVVLAAADFDAKLKERVLGLYFALARQALLTLEFRQLRAQKNDKKPDLARSKSQQKELVETTIDDLEQVLVALRAESQSKVAAQPAP